VTRHNEDRVPDWLVEKVHQGLASEDERATVLASSDARARLEALPAQDRLFHEKFPIDEEIRRIDSKYRVAQAASERSNRAPMAWGLAIPLLVAGLALLLVGIPQDPARPGNPDGHDADGPTRVKGLDSKLKLYRNRADGIGRIGEGTVTREGDILQLGLVRGEATHGAVVSVDGRGSVTLHFPTEVGKSTALGTGEQHLPEAYELDDAPEFERFFFVTTQGKATDVSTVVHAAEALAAQGEAREGDLALPSGYAQTSILVRKEAK
jgi:hypothetical protein